MIFSRYRVNAWRVKNSKRNNSIPKSRKMTTINVKPLSVNACRQGRRFKTKAYKEYEKFLLKVLPDIYIPEWNLSLEIEWGFSSRASDNTNPLKPFEDILQKRYGFNDSRVYQTTIRKHLVKKWQEYIQFSISNFVENSIEK